MTHPSTIRPKSRNAGLVAFSLLAALVTSLFVAGPAHADTTTAGATPPGKAWIRAGHFVPGFGAARVDLRPTTGQASAIVMSPNATYGDVTSYQKIQPGTYVVDVRSSDAGQASSPMLSRSFTVAAGTASTVAVLGAASAPRLAVLTDDLTPPAAGTARVRVLSASANASSLTVQAVNGPLVAKGAVLGQTTAYTTVPQGRWTLALSGANGSTSSQSVNLASGSVYTAVALDTGSTGVRLAIVTDAAGAAMTPTGAAATGLGGASTPAASSSLALGGPLGLAGLLALVLVGFASVRYAALRRTRHTAPAVARATRTVR
ncbi:MAG: DUF4397 domain-containing protein [Actinomycetota bacterium]|nr:DUF4397 domain-containing protein [Actinomycetota bacterium]